MTRAPQRTRLFARRGVAVVGVPALPQAVTQLSPSLVPGDLCFSSKLLLAKMC